MFPSWPHVGIIWIISAIVFTVLEPELCGPEQKAPISLCNPHNAP